MFGAFTQGCAKKSSSWTRTDGGPAKEDAVEGVAEPACWCFDGSGKLPARGEEGGEGLSGTGCVEGEVWGEATEDAAVELGGGCSGRSRMTAENVAQSLRIFNPPSRADARRYARSPSRRKARDGRRVCSL